MELKRFQKHLKKILNDGKLKYFPNLPKLIVLVDGTCCGWYNCLK